MFQIKCSCYIHSHNMDKACQSPSCFLRMPNHETRKDITATCLQLCSTHRPKWMPPYHRLTMTKISCSFAPLTYFQRASSLGIGNLEIFINCLHSSHRQLFSPHNQQAAAALPIWIQHHPRNDTSLPSSSYDASYASYLFLPLFLGR